MNAVSPPNIINQHPLSLIKHPSSLINPAPLQSCRMATAHPHVCTEQTSEHARITLTVNERIELVPQVRMQERALKAGAALATFPGDANLAWL